MDRGKIVAVITGIFSILLAVIYLVIVQILDFRGEMKPAPMSQLEAPLVANFDGETRGWGDGEMGRQGDGEMGRWGDKGQITPNS
ncbi:hypothetical protein [Rivularia sp. UHCC 0363]|uniref:hypothetical protein n=1 Tax=Rivularia sp. UHCC 0363 TaxID=3110244 RepID=UPI002B210400|nr:hypothetical protein [Rivularia sp. UHCC 0363]MEA5598639.1 hypothetical protein [Rivularia sp. UHCC 0363]